MLQDPSTPEDIFYSAILTGCIPKIDDRLGLGRIASGTNVPLDQILLSYSPTRNPAPTSRSQPVHVELPPLLSAIGLPNELSEATLPSWINMLGTLYQDAARSSRKWLSRQRLALNETVSLER